MGDEGLVGAIMRPVESAVGAVGMRHPWQRFAVGACIGLALFYATKPAISFDTASGSARPWALLDDSGSGGVQPTHLPAWLGASLVGIAFATFI